MRWALAALALVGCTPGARAPVTTTGATFRSAFGLDGKASGCRAFDLQLPNAARTRFLRLGFDARQAGISAAHGDLDVTKLPVGARFEVVVFAQANPELPDCSDVDTPQPAVLETWSATAGHVLFDYAKDEPEGGPFRVRVRVRGVHFRGPNGAEKTIDDDLGTLQVGWLPG